MRLLLTALLILSMLCSCKPHNSSFQGYVEGQNMYLASPFSGILKELAVKRGSPVEKGQLLVILDPDPQKITIQQVQAELLQAQHTLVDLEKPKRLPEIAFIEAQILEANSQIKLAELRVERYKKLFEKNASDKDTYDAALSNLEQQKDKKKQFEANLALAKLGSREDQIKAQKAQINTLLAKLNNAKWELAQKTISAPDSGIIYDTYYEMGEFVPSQQPVLSLLISNNIRLEFFIPLEYLSQVHVGQTCYFNCLGCKKNNLAEISYISPDAEFIPPLVYSQENYAKLVFRVKARVKNPSLFKPGQPVLVNLL